MPSNGQRLSGFATPEGTARFAKRAIDAGQVDAGHFRQSHTGLTLSSLGMGTYLGKPGPEDDALMTDALKASVKSGAVNVIDSAINYRFMCSERAVGAGLKTLIESGELQRDEIFVATKNGFITPDASLTEQFPVYFKEHYLDKGVCTPEDIAQGMHCMSKGFLENQLEQSLSNLGLETLDLMYLHNASESQIPEVGLNRFIQRLEGAFQFLESARKAGKIQYYGMATWDAFRTPPSEHSGFFSLEACVALAEDVGGPNHGFRFVQLPYNMALIEAFTMTHQRLKGQPVSLLQSAVQQGIDIFASVPLMQAQLLTQVPVQFPGLAHPAQNCLQFVRSTPGIMAPLVGHKQPDHVEQNLGVAKVAPLTAEEFESFFVAGKA